MEIKASASVGKASKIGSKIGGRIGGGKNSELGDNEAVQYSEPGNKVLSYSFNFLPTFQTNSLQLRPIPPPQSKQKKKSEKKHTPNGSLP